MMMKSLWQGYIFSRAINGNVIPQRVQNLVLRNYAETLDLNLEFSAAEYRMENCYMILQGLIESIDKYAGLIIYSLHMLPADVDERQIILQRIIDGGREVRFALENLTIRTKNDISFVEDIFLAKTLSCEMGVLEM